jgi:hypothetical protein
VGWADGSGLTQHLALRTRCGHFAFAFTPNRERPSEIRRAWARALTATTVRPRSAAMSKTKTLEMVSSRSRSSSSEVQAFALFSFFASVSPCSFPALDAAGLYFFASALAGRLTLTLGPFLRRTGSRFGFAGNRSLFSDYGLAGTISCRPRGNVSDRRTVVSNPLLYARRCAGSWLSYVILRSRVAS